MSDIEVVKRGYEAFRQRDIAAIFSLLDPNVTLAQSKEVPWGGEFHGVDGAREFFTRLTGAVDSVVEPEQFLLAGDKVAVIGRTHGTVRANGRSFDVPVVHLWTVWRGKVLRFEAYIDNPAMLAALSA